MAGKEAQRQEPSGQGPMSLLHNMIFHPERKLRGVKQLKTEPNCVVEDLAAIGTDPTLDRTVRPPEESGLLSAEARTVLDDLTSNMDPKIRQMLDEHIFYRVEVREILDWRNPAKLFSLMGQKAYGVFAKRDFQKDEPVLCYAGHLMDNDTATKAFDSYIFDVDSDAYFDKETRLVEDFAIPDLLIDGRNSIAGRINDPISIGGTVQRCANLTTSSMFDPETHNPMVVLHAKRAIKAGEELLYNYGVHYWRVIWKIMMMEQGNYIAKTDLYTQKLLEELSSNNISMKESSEESTESSGEESSEEE